VRDGFYPKPPARVVSYYSVRERSCLGWLQKSGHQLAMRSWSSWASLRGRMEKNLCRQGMQR